MIIAIVNKIYRDVPLDKKSASLENSIIHQTMMLKIAV
jgi:hypothetical protein